ncbi:MAG: hypothetical protein BWY74_00915 [Firmicutes bacterium ADurb.Bin419]|nr:MAG: hypothetical protein BWY74_00915 [Firmicutes bacterium ADurb.Bin419]
MYKINNLASRKNNIAHELIHEPGIHLHIHWLNPLLSKHTSS